MNYFVAGQDVEADRAASAKTTVRIYKEFSDVYMSQAQNFELRKRWRSLDASIVTGGFWH